MAESFQRSELHC